MDQRRSPLLSSQQAGLVPVNPQLARTSLGWSFEQLAKESGVEVASVYLLERLGTAGPDDDARMWDILNKHLLERSQGAAVQKPEQSIDFETSSVSDQ